MARLYTEFIPTDSRYDITSVNFNDKIVHEDNIFGRQDILQIFSRVSKDCKNAKSPKLHVDTLTTYLS